MCVCIDINHRAFAQLSIVWSTIIISSHAVNVDCDCDERAAVDDWVKTDANDDIWYWSIMNAWVLIHNHYWLSMMLVSIINVICACTIYYLLILCWSHRRCYCCDCDRRIIDRRIMMRRVSGDQCADQRWHNNGLSETLTYITETEIETMNNTNNSEDSKRNYWTATLIHFHYIDAHLSIVVP